MNHRPASCRHPHKETGLTENHRPIIQIREQDTGKTIVPSSRSVNRILVKPSSHHPDQGTGYCMGNHRTTIQIREQDTGKTIVPPSRSVNRILVKPSPHHPDQGKGYWETIVPPSRSGNKILGKPSSRHPDQGTGYWENHRPASQIREQDTKKAIVPPSRLGYMQDTGKTIVPLSRSGNRILGKPSSHHPD
jgi:hypothetical protein